MRVTRRHHPLLGQQLDVVQANKATLIVKLQDGSRLKLPRDWTDMDGRRPCSALDGEPRFTVAGLRQLLQLLERLGEHP